MRLTFALTLFLLLSGLRLSAQGQPDGPTLGPSIKFDVMEHDFGTVNEGDSVVYRFKFKNTGSAPLQLSNVVPSCGCTAPVWPHDPIPPGGTAEVKARFDSNGRPGSAYKTLTITSNATGEPVRLILKGNVTPRQQTPAPEQAPMAPVNPTPAPTPGGNGR